MTLIDSKPAGCVCTKACRFPCFQRLGLTTQKCCPACVPLPKLDDDGGATA